MHPLSATKPPQCSTHCSCYSPFFSQAAHEGNTANTCNDWKLPQQSTALQGDYSSEDQRKPSSTNPPGKQEGCRTRSEVTSIYLFQIKTNVLHYIFCPQIIYRIELHHSVIGVAVMNDFVKNEQRLAHDIMQVLRDNGKA